MGICVPYHEYTILINCAILNFYILSIIQLLLLCIDPDPTYLYT